MNKLGQNLIDVDISKYKEELFTVIFNSIENEEEIFQNWFIEAELTLGFGLNGNYYITPPNSRGFNAHYDIMDVVIIQLKGEKIWHVCDPLPEYNYEQTTIYELEDIDESTCETLTLTTPSLLYLPRGTIHWAQTRENKVYI
eukprot:UN32736